MSHDLPTLEDLEIKIGDLSGKKALVRVDFNVPMQDGEIMDDFRIRASLPTIEWLQSRGVDINLCSHLGRPKSSDDPEFSLDPVRIRLKELGVEANLLPNLRYSPGEKNNSEDFVLSLIEGMDFYVNEAFGVAHRQDASVVGPPKYLPSALGIRFLEEIEQLDHLLTSSNSPFTAVLGGLKISDKLPVVEALLDKVDSLLIGGAMAYTFLKAQGLSVGSSLVEDSMLDKCKELLDGDVPIYLPTDFVTLEDGGEIGIVNEARVENYKDEVPEGWAGADIGPETGALFSEQILESGTVFWNGPVGAYEDSRFAAGTAVIADAMSETQAFTYVGGGDSAAAVAELGLDNQMDYISTGGGASLEYIKMEDLPALKAIRDSAGNL